MEAVTHCGLILLTVFTPRLGALLQTDAFLQDLSKVIFFHCLFWRVKVTRAQSTVSYYYFTVTGERLYMHLTFKAKLEGPNESICKQQCERVPWTHLESSARGNAW